MMKILSNSFAVLSLVGCLIMGASTLMAQTGAPPVNVISIPNIPLSITSVEMQQLDDGSFALTYSIANDAPVAASEFALTLITHNADGLPVGGQSWSVHRPLDPGSTMVLFTTLTGTFQPDDRVSISTLNAHIGDTQLDSDIPGIALAAESGSNQTIELAQSSWLSADPLWFPATPNAGCSTNTTVLSPPPDATSDPPPPAPPACDPIPFCEKCTTTAVTVCGSGRVLSVSCDGLKCICSYTCKTANQ